MMSAWESISGRLCRTHHTHHFRSDNRTLAFGYISWTAHDTQDNPYAVRDELNKTNAVTQTQIELIDK